MRSSGIPEKWIKKRFDQLDPGDNKAYSSMIEFVRSWNFKDPISFVMLSENNGIGKTHIAVCLIRKFIYSYLKDRFIKNPDYNFQDLKFPNIFIFDSTLYRRIQESYSERSHEKESDIINQLSKQPFLVIDDLFSARDNEFARKVILDILNLRIDWNNLPTFITSNLTREHIRAIDPRIDSRMNNGTVIELNTIKKDWRGIDPGKTKQEIKK